MTEAQSAKPAATQSPTINKRGVFDIAFILLLLSLLVVAFWKGPIWPDRIGVLVGLFPPLLLGLFRTWSRISHPDRLPIRWPKNSRLEQRLTTLTLALTGVFFLFMFPWFVVDIKTHPIVDHTCILIAITAQCWCQFLDRYIADRKYIPPDPQYDPSKTWATTHKPLRSEHWGVAGSDPNAVP